MRLSLGLRTSLILGLTAASIPAQDLYTTDFETGAEQWTIQSNNSTHQWAIDSEPSVFTSPMTTLNNTDDASDINITGSPSSTAFSPPMHMVQTGDRIVQFRCYRSHRADFAAGGLPERVMLWGSSLTVQGADFRVRFYLETDPPAPSPNFFDVPCPNGSWHLHDIRVTVGGLTIDGQPMGLSGQVADAIRQRESHQIAFRFTWVLVPGTAGDDGGSVTTGDSADDHIASFWAIDDFTMAAQLEDPFNPDPLAAGGGAGATGNACMASATRASTGSAAAMLAALAIMAALRRSA